MESVRTAVDGAKGHKGAAPPCSKLGRNYTGHRSLQKGACSTPIPAPSVAVAPFTITDPSDHNEAIYVIMMQRSGRSRWPEYAAKP